MKALLASLGVGSAIAPTYGIYDWFAGDTTGVNSGEIPLNYLISQFPALTAAAGGAATALDPNVRAAVSSYSLERELQKAQNGAPMGSGRAVDLNELNRVQQEIEKSYGGRIKELMAMDPRLDYDEALRMLRTRAARRGLAGAAIGATAGSIPAIQWMADSQKAPQGTGS